MKRPTVTSAGTTSRSPESGRHQHPAGRPCGRPAEFWTSAESVHGCFPIDDELALYLAADARADPVLRVADPGGAGRKRVPDRRFRRPNPDLHLVELRNGADVRPDLQSVFRDGKIHRPDLVLHPAARLLRGLFPGLPR